MTDHEAVQLALANILEGIQQVGAHRHPHVWFEANRAAVNAMRACNAPMNFEMTRLVSLVTLRVLDVTKPERTADTVLSPDTMGAGELAGDFQVIKPEE